MYNIEIKPFASFAICQLADALFAVNGFLLILQPQAANFVQYFVFFVV
jgi:hypothetical protein